MKKATQFSENMFNKVFGIFIFLTFFYFTSLFAQATDESKIGNDFSNELEDEISLNEPSPEKAQESAEKKQTLEELLAVPFLEKVPALKSHLLVLY